MFKNDDETVSKITCVWFNILLSRKYYSTIDYVSFFMKMIETWVSENRFLLTKTLHVAAGLSELKKNNTDIQNKNKKYYARQRAYGG